MMVAGHGSPVLVVPGIQGRWEWMRPAIDALSASHRVLTFSLTEAASDADCFAEWDACIDRLLDQAGGEPATMVGVSFGGLAALHYASRRPERVASLVLVSTPPPSWSLDAWRRRCLRHPIACAPLFAVRGAWHLVPEIVASQRGWPARLHVLGQHLLRIVRFPASPVRMAAWARTWQTQSDAIDWSRLTMPVLLMTGEPELDAVVPPALSLAYLDLLPQTRHVVLPRTGHIGLVTRPHAFARLIGDFA